VSETFAAIDSFFWTTIKKYQ